MANLDGAALGNTAEDILYDASVIQVILRPVCLTGRPARLGALPPAQNCDEMTFARKPVRPKPDRAGKLLRPSNPVWATRLNAASRGACST